MLGFIPRDMTCFLALEKKIQSNIFILETENEMFYNLSSQKGFHLVTGQLFCELSFKEVIFYTCSSIFAAKRDIAS